MTRLIAALLILVACGVAPAGYAQDDCDEAALAAGECGDAAAQADGASADAAADPSAGTPAPAAPANCNGGFIKKNGRCPPAPAPAQTGPMTIYVGNLNWETSDNDLKELFAPYGTVSKAVIVRDQANGNRSRGFGFVTMPDRAEAEAAIGGLNQIEIMGRKLVVNDSQPRSGR